MYLIRDTIKQNKIHNLNYNYTCKIVILHFYVHKSARIKSYYRNEFLIVKILKI